MTTEPSHGFAVARRREVQQRKALEPLEIFHRGVQRADELFGGIELGEGLTSILRESLLKRGGRRRVPFEEPGEAENAEKGQRKASREQRIDHAGGRRQQRPARTSRDRDPERETRHVDERAKRARL